MSQWIISQRYAKALYQLAEETGVLKAIYADIEQLKKLLNNNKEFHDFVNNPLFTIAEKERVITAIFGQKLHELTTRTIRFMIHKNRLQCLDEMVIAFDDLYFSSHHQVRATVQTALPLADEQKRIIKQHLEEKSSKEVSIHWEINRSLIGGFRIFMDGYLYDYSFSHQLEEYKQHVNQTHLSLQTK